VVELNKGVSAGPIIAKLFKLSRLEDTYSFNQVALIDKSPKLLNLAQLVEAYIVHQREVLLRKTQYDADKIKAKIHILEGLLIALEDIDNVIKLIKNSESAAAAKVKLMEQYGLSEIQAKAILDMKLSKLAKLEKIEIQTDLANLKAELARLMEILANPVPELNDIFTHIKDMYGDERRTTITQVETATKEEKEIEFVEPEKCVVVMTEGGLIKRVPSSSFRVQKRNGKGVKTQDDITNAVIRTNTIDSLMVFSNLGKMYRLLVNDIPEGTNATKGQSIKSLIAMDANEEAKVIYSIYRDTDAKYVLFTTKNGLVKKTALDEYTKTKKKSGIAAITIKDNDELMSVNLINDEDIVLLTLNGMGIRFNSSEVSTTSRTASGMKGITLADNDYVIASIPVRDKKDDLAVFATTGLGKRIHLSELPVQHRAGKGLTCYKGVLADGTMVNDEDMVLICGNSNSICISAKDIPVFNRVPLGNQLIKNSNILSVSKV
jgi:DNA gyrase subunit A